MLVSEADFLQCDGRVGKPREGPHEFDHRVSGVDDARQRRIAPSCGDARHLVGHFGRMVAKHDDVLRDTTKRSTIHAVRCRAVDDQILLRSMHRLCARWIVLDDAERTDRHIRLPGESAGKLSHLVDMRLHRLLGDLLKLRHVAILVLTNHVQSSDDEFPDWNRIAIIVLE